MVPINVRLRPILSLMNPATMPPAALAMRVTALMAPAWAFVRPNSCRSVCSANTSSITSMASSMKPSMAAHNARQRPA